MSIFDKPLFVYEMANNHQGSVEHGIEIIREMKRVSAAYTQYFNFAVKFQYRNLETFIHPAAKNRADIKNVKRFQETRLNKEQFAQLLKEVKACGFYSMCTPFDEDSAELIIEQDFDIVKIASCSFTDWSLLEKIGGCNKPVIASAAGSSIEDIDNVVAFFKNRRIDLTLMHCIAEYPTTNDNLQMNQIDFYKSRYKNIRIGFSTHEMPDNLEPIKAAVAKGAVVFEKHVGVPTETITLNGYSAAPDQVGRWLETALNAYMMNGVSGMRYQPNQKELEDLAALQRGIFAKADISGGEKITENNIFRAFPCVQGQLLSKHLSKYKTYQLKRGLSIPTDGAVMLQDVDIIDNYDLVREIVHKVIDLIKRSGAVIPVNSSCELSHHYGLDEFYHTGVTMIECINREYCKKILVVLPGQAHPSHMHIRKEETFTVIYGRLEAECNGESFTVEKGESFVVERGVYHSFSSKEGCVFEEISTMHYSDDSYYTQASDFVTPRKTKVYITKEILNEEA